MLTVQPFMVGSGRRNDEKRKMQPTVSEAGVPKKKLQVAASGVSADARARPSLPGLGLHRTALLPPQIMYTVVYYVLTSCFSSPH